jgi:hypothetical protein
MEDLDKVAVFDGHNDAMQHLAEVGARLDALPTVAPLLAGGSARKNSTQMRADARKARR